MSNIEIPLHLFYCQHLDKPVRFKESKLSEYGLEEWEENEVAKLYAVTCENGYYQLLCERDTEELAHVPMTEAKRYIEVLQ